MIELRQEFHEGLDQIRAEAVRMGSMVIDMIGLGTQAFLDRDLGGASRVIEADEAVDVLALDLEDQCVKMLALQAPIAGDLRFLLTSLRMVMELERSADLAKNICKGSRRIFDVTLPPRIAFLIEAMSREASMMTKHAVEAYSSGDAGLGGALDDIDDRLDELQVDLMEEIFRAHHEQELPLQAGVELAMACRFYERIGDHAVNIGERVVHMVTGWLPEYDAVGRAQVRGQVVDGEATAPEAE